MQKEEMISLSAMQHVALIGVYQSLAWDLRFGTRNTRRQAEATEIESSTEIPKRLGRPEMAHQIRKALVQNG